MKIRRYLGKNTQEAILKVKMDLGNDAVILNTRKVRQKGLFNMFAKPMVEVLAAIDDDYGAAKERVVKQKEEQPKAVVREIPNPVKEEQTAAVAQSQAPEEPEKSKKITELENKVQSMETMLRKIYEQVQNPGQKPDEALTEEKQPVAERVSKFFHSNLVKNEVESEISDKIINMVNEKLGDSASMNDTASVTYNIISGIIGQPEPIKLREDGKPTVVIFIGPTGVGKTTTLAKIAANFALHQKKKVGMITADTYRIAAVEQLKTYAEILAMPVDVIYSPTEVKEAIGRNSDKDIILIDTAGRSYRNKTQFDELKALVLACEADEVYLVLSATTSGRNIKEIINNYSFLENYKLIFTKLDETLTNGVILNTKMYTGKKLSYVTNGQSVPDDIEVANTDKITKSLLGSIQ
ncbi:MAG: flagellar biosynthesis protein FlhF [Bacillota bacterium]|nr:flagellar biosynthesis protein FlhF [Bacillota bacterium]